jgi:hypothetical protein
MKRLSYLQQVPPQPPAPRRGGVALLSPPRLVFRPGPVAAGFVVTEARSAAFPAGPSRPIGPPAPSAASLAGPGGLAASPGLGDGRPARQAELSAMDLLRPPRAAAPAAAVPNRVAREVAPRLSPDATGPGENGHAATEQRQPLRPAPPAATRPAIERIFPPGPPLPRIVAPLPVGLSSSPGPIVATMQRDAEAVPAPSRGRIMERPIIPSPSPAPKPAESRPPSPIHRTPAASLAVPPDSPSPPPSTGRSGAPPHDGITLKAALPVITPPAPPHLPIPPSSRERAGPDLHIGTLEVRVVAPPAPPLAAGMPRSTPRQGTRAAAASSGRIARGFGVFGLGQS